MKFEIRAGFNAGCITIIDIYNLRTITNLIFIYDIVDIFDLTVKLYADCVKMYAIINDVNDSVLVQEGLGACYAWSDLWQLPLSLHNYCTSLHLGRNNTLHS